MSAMPGSGRRRRIDVAHQYLPHSIENEEALIGSLLISPDAILYVLDVLGENGRAFYVEKLSWIYEAIVALNRRGEGVDTITVADELRQRGQLEKIGGEAELTRLIAQVPTALYAPEYARRIADDAVRRRLVQAAGKIAKIAHDYDRDMPTADALAEILAIDEGSGDQVIEAEGIWPQYLDLLARRATIKSTGLLLGFRDADNIIGGLRPGQFVIIGGRPSMGKTTLAECIADNVASLGHRVLFASLEMSTEQLMDRRAARLTAVDGPALRQGAGREEVMEATGTAGPIDYLDAPALTTSELWAKAYRRRALDKLNLLIVDYLQLLRDEIRSGSATERITVISRNLKTLARELGIPLIAVSQLSRAAEARQDKRPQLADLRQSGALEQDADLVILVYREKYYDPDCPQDVAEFDIAKNRDGPVGRFELIFQPERFRFVPCKRVELDF